jgi:hypothetical protein
MTELFVKENLLKELRKKIHDSNTPTNTLISLMTANNVDKPGKLSRGQLEDNSMQIVNALEFGRYLPQPYALTSSFVSDVLDPVLTVPGVTGMYRVTMRKLLRLTLSQLQQQAVLMKLDLLDLDEEGIAASIMINLKDDTPLIRPLILILLAKEIAYVYGIRFEVPLRGSRHPSSTVFLVVKPMDMVQNLNLTREDLLAECENQGFAVNRNEDKRQLAIRLVVKWTQNPGQLRQPFTPGFAAFLLERADVHR